MSKRRNPISIATRCLLLALLVVLSSAALGAQKFYPDDPVTEMPDPMNVEEARFRKLNDYVDFFMNVFGEPGERQPTPEEVRKSDGKLERIPARSANTLGEAPDSAWFTNRIGSRPMTVEEVVRGPGNENAPAEEGPWTIISAKTEGVTPGFRIKDATGRGYLLKFDPLDHPEMATGADVIGSAFFHALGYNVPQNYLVAFHPEKLEIAEDTTVKDIRGEERPMTRSDVTLALMNVPRDDQGRIRGLASFLLPGKILGEFRYFGTRSDDPNDVIRHEHRRELRGLFVFCAWLNHSDSRAINTLDSLVEENGLQFVKHFLIDFGSILGSASVRSNSARDGNAYFWEFKPALAQILTLGVYTPRWMRSNFKKSPALGMIEYPSFEPEQFKPNYPSPAFDNRLPDDEFWAAKKVMAFSDEQIRAVVKLARYSNPADEELLTKYLIGRRDRIGEAYFAKVLPLDQFEVEDGVLKFEDLEVKYGFRGPRNYKVEWSRFDNGTERHDPIEGAGGFLLPEPIGKAELGEYFAAKISGDSESKTVRVYLRKKRDTSEVVGIERTW